MPELPLGNLTGWIAVALICAALACWLHIRRHGIRFRIYVRFAGDDSDSLPGSEILLAAIATLLTAVVLYAIAAGHPQTLRLIWAAAGTALLLAASYWAWAAIRDFSLAESEDQREWRRAAAEAGRQLRESLDETEVQANSCAVLREKLAASDVRLYLREGQTVNAVHDTTGRAREPQSYQLEAPLPSILARAPAGLPYSFYDAGQRLAVPLASGSALHGFFLVSGGPYPLSQLRFAAAIARETTRSLEVAASLEKAAEARSASKIEQREKENALRALAHLVPSDSPRVPGLDFASATWRGDRPGGQFIDLLALPQGALGLILAELPGYGLDAAVRMSQLQTLLRSRFWACAGDLTELLQSTSRALLAANPATAPIRIFLACYRPADRNLTYVNAGALPPLLVRRGGEGAQLLRLSVSAPLLCSNTGEPAMIAEMAMEPGDLLAIVSSGLTEAMNLQGEAWGEARLVDTLINGEAQPAAELVPLILNAAETHAGQDLSSPDRVLILLKT